MSFNSEAAMLDGIAIIGMSGRFPGARNVDEFWNNLCAGVESIRPFSAAEITAGGLDPGILQQPNFINAGAPIDDAEMFDAPFFGVTPREATSLDPQRRVFLECAWHALENAGYVPENVDCPIGVFAGSSSSSYIYKVQANPEIVAAVGGYQIMIGNDKDHLTTYTAYKLNLTGPAITVQTACSTSLVAASMACQSLLNEECDLALAGGVSVRVPQHFGYFYEEGGILSPDGHCRTFDASAKGTVGGNGVGVVVLKRLPEALRDGDCIRAVILGSAINNDGSQKVGYTAPSVDGQASVITTAMTLAGVEPETLGYIEAHGTATPLGDPIEIAALIQAFGKTRRRNFCGIGSVKSNIGHLDAASGVAGLIKTALCLERKALPPSLHFEKPNPAIDLENSPLYVQDRLCEWDPGPGPRRAAVSAFGIGGTNAHAVLEEAPEAEPSSASRDLQVLVLSARSESALERMTENLLLDLQTAPARPLADIAFTLAIGRRAFPHRRYAVCRDVQDAISAFQEPRRVASGIADQTREPVFLFPGQGSQHAGMGRDLYDAEPLFRQEVDQCAMLLQPHLGCDVRQAIFGLGATDEELRQTWLAQPALFTLEYALACLLMSWGIAPAAMIGHSIGEYVAACLSGVFSLEDALAIVAVRGKLMQQTESGAMVATDLPEREVRQLLPAGVDVAAVNGPAQTVLSGREPDIARLEELLLARGASSVRLRTSHAFHSATMDPILDEFRAQLQVVKLRPPTVPYISNLTGTWQTARAAVADYWVEHLRQSVKFGDGCHELVRNGHLTFVEVGPGPALSKLAQQFLRATPNGTAFHVGLTQNSLADGLGKLWTCGVPISWPKYFSGERRCRVPLPPYPFEWQRYDIEPAAASPAVPALTKNPNPMMWFYLPAWRQTRPQLNVPDGGSYLFFLDPSGLGTSVAESLGPAGTRLILVEPGEAFHQMDERSFRIRPEEPGDYLTLFEALRQAGTLPEQILHFWNVDSRPSAPGKGFYSLLHLAQALAMTSQPMRVNVISTGVHSVIGNEAIDALKATLLGPCRVAPHEQPSIYWRNIDVEWPGTDATRQVIGECAADSLEPVVAYRASTRWTETIEPAPLPPNSRHGSLLRSGGTYLITGGMGGIGLTIAEYLAREYRARLALVGRSPLAEDSPKRQKLAALESDGAEVLTFAADVADMEQMRQVLNQVQERFGALNGVIHSAGIAGGGMIQIKERTVAQAVLSPKVEGTLTLDALLRDVKLDFFAVFSSLTALLGGFGQVDYCAANSFLDAYARSQKARRDRVTVSINWDAWDEVGMAVNTALPAEMEAHRAQVLKDAIHPKEGAEVFHWALESGLPTISVSTVYLPWRVEQSRIAMWAQIGSSAAPPTPSMAERHPRPQIRTDFIPPETEMENMIAKIWQDLLGLEQVGVRDNFLELGGHSLLATQMASRMRSSLGVEISVRKIFELPTIAELAKMVDTTMTESDEVSRMIAMVEEMSEEQVKTELERTE